jgi:uncharacterized protein YndB with AHSA1/START domain
MSAENTTPGATSNAGAAPLKQTPAIGRKLGIFRTILLVVAAIVVVFVGVVAVQPPDFRISRSITIDAPPSDVFAQVNDFHNWEAWSPWAKLDPAAKNSFEGASAGTGAIFKWSGNDQIGEGKMTITETRPDELVRIKLEFVRPFEDTSTADFTFRQERNGTVVTWSMYGQKKFINKAICLFMDMDKMLGSEFEKGLAQMKTIAEKSAGK